MKKFGGAFRFNILFILLCGCSGEVRQAISVHKPYKHVVILPPVEGIINQTEKDAEFATAIESILIEHNLPKNIKLIKENRSFSYQLVLKTENFSFCLNGVKLCKFEIKSIKLENGQIFVTGDIPLSIEPKSNRSSENEQTVNEPVKNHMDDDTSSFETGKCLFQQNGELIPATKIIFRKEGLPYEAYVADGRILEINDRFINAEGKAHIWNSNPVKGKITEYTFPIANENGPLANKNFVTITSHQEKAIGNKGTFDFPPQKDPRFEETSLFTNANRILAWFKNLGVDQFSEQAIPLIIDDDMTDSSMINNSVYTIPDDKTPPTVIVGKGDDKNLKNLRTDSSVIFHELSHHFIYRTIKTLQGDSIVYHEGLSDYFAAAVSNDPCIGPGTCPENSNICYLPGECLRTASNNLALGSPDMPKDFHLKGQIISGTLWSIRSLLEPSVRDSFDRFAVHAVSFLSSSPDIADFGDVLLIADSQLNKGSFCNLIKQELSRRAFPFNDQRFLCQTTMPSKAEGALKDIEEANIRQKEQSGLYNKNETNTDNTSWETSHLSKNDLKKENPPEIQNKTTNEKDQNTAQSQPSSLKDEHSPYCGIFPGNFRYKFIWLNILFLALPLICSLNTGKACTIRRK
ncbi:MAG: hypothetical protein HQK54_06895 [Oligoflexales bacterium]|nr:hypothetical protein [Oligoflexales bacterium]